MRHYRAWLVLVGLSAVVGLFALGAVGASAQVILQHGIGLTKGCDSPTKIDDPYLCGYTIRNVLDEANDTLTINQLIDTVNASGGPVISGNILNLAQVTTTLPSPPAPPNTPSGATCVAASGDGITTPYTGVTSCTLPAGSRVNVLPFSHYTVQPGDWNLPGHTLTDNVSLAWHDLCDGTPTSNCNQNPANATQPGQSLLQQLDSQTATAIHNAAHDVVTAVTVGTNVHDFVTVTGQGGHPNPTGNVSIDWFPNGTCDVGTAAASSGPLGPLDANGQFDATGFNFTVNTPGMYAFQATYLGDNRYTSSTGPCEPLQVLQPDANIQLTPGTATNAVGTNHTLHCHVNVSPDGTTFSDAPDGTVCTVTITSGPGTPTAQNCTTSGGTGTCDVVITSATAGTTTLSASTTVVVNGVTLTRMTDGTAGNSGPATKVWVDANIQISPPTATNAVGTNHVLTITVNAINGTIDAGGGTATASIVSGPGSFVGPNTCTYTGGGASASCTVTITSTATGTTVVSATSNIPVSGQVISRTTATNPGPGGSDNASKVWVDANINITPATANNPVGANHVLTITVNAINGTIDAGGGTATASIVSGPGSFVGSPTCTYTGGAATASCTVTITSSTAGTTVVSATSNIPVNGVSIPRTTGTATNTASGGSDNASKNWADDTVVTHVRDAAGNDVTGTSVPSGTVVHDEATVTKTAATPAAVPAPTGTVTFTLFNGTGCNGSVVATDPNKPLNASGLATSVTFTTPTAGGLFSYLAHYNGDANYPAKDAGCEPFMVNAVQGHGRITGGGSIFATVDGVPNTRITHGFELRCDASDPRQSLEINWPGANSSQNNFHLSKLINSVVCFDDPLSSPPPPPGTVFDTYAGNTLFQGHTGFHGFGYAVGTGTCNNKPATIYFILVDNGEPGTTDVAEYHITGGCTLNVGPAVLTFGNHQFHTN
jgi:hypothetical protein